MDVSNADLPAFLDFCKSLDAAVVHTPEQALQLYRSEDRRVATTAPSANNLARDLRLLREQIVQSGIPLLGEDDLDRERAVRRGEKPSAE